jgi:hypothetical protein
MHVYTGLYSIQVLVNFASVGEWKVHHRPAVINAVPVTFAVTEA